MTTPKSYINFQTIFRNLFSASLLILLCMGCATSNTQPSNNSGDTGPASDTHDEDAGETDDAGTDVASAITDEMIAEIQAKSHKADDAYAFLTEVLQKLKNKELANVDEQRTPEISRQINRGRETALHLMVQEEDIAIVKLLLRLGAKIDSLDVQDRTPVHFACCRDGRSYDKYDPTKSFEIAKVLLESKTTSSIDWKNMKMKIEDKTPIDYVNENNRFTPEQKVELLTLLRA